ncbi:MAG: hypothetical protein H6R10_436 [Rhodocyclaceae bacterium]|nr:hypothetical protein [Rhodocyclaceae bacterium]
MRHRLWQSICRNIIAPSRLSLANVQALLLPRGRSLPVRRHIAAIIAARVQLIAALFAVLVPLGSVADLLVFDFSTAAHMIGLRLLAAGLFVVLAWPRELSAAASYRQAMAMLVILLMVPPLFHLLSAGMLNAAAHDRTQQLLAQLYGYLPTVVLGGLAIFPLTALEIGLLALPVIVTAIVTFMTQGIQFNLVEQGGTLWFMVMMLGVAMFSGMSQCHYIASLVHRAMHDPLTGAFTRQSGEEALKLFYQLSEISGKTLSVAFIDLDRFKAINDGYGHEAGDQALRDVANRLRSSLRRSDFLIRWGGEEFMAVLPDTPPENILNLFQRLRDLGLGLRPDGMPLTASIGIACSSEADITAWPTLVNRADERMYAAKQHGRDCMVLPGGQLVRFLP